MARAKKRFLISYKMETMSNKYKSGTKWMCDKRTDDWTKETWLLNWKNLWAGQALGIRVKDSETGDIVFEEER